MATQIGPKIGIEGEKEYRAQMQQIIDQAKTLDAAMNKTASAWDKNTSEMTKNKAQAQKLVQQIELFEGKLALMNTMLEKSAEKYGENDRKTQAWQRAIDNTTASINNMRSQLDSLNNAQNFSGFATQMADVGTRIQNIGANISAVGQKLTMSLTLPLVAAGTAAVKLGSDMNESANKVDVVFGEMSQSVKDFAKTTTDMYAISEGRALQMAGDYGAMAKAMGMSEQEASKLAIELVGLAGDMASYHNKEIEVASNSLRGLFTGETEALKQFSGAIGQVAFEEFAAKQGKVYNQMSQAEKVMTRYQYLLETQRDAIGDSMRTADEFAGSTRRMTASLENAASALGQALVPIITPVIQALTKLLQKFTELPEPVQKFIAVTLTIVAVIGPVIMIIGVFTSSIGSLITFIAGIPGAIATATTAIAAFAAALGISVPILAALAVAAIAVGAGIAAMVENWDAISAAIVEFGNSVKDAYNKLIEQNDKILQNIDEFTDDIISYFKELPAKIKQAIKEMVQQVKDEFNNLIRSAKQSGQDFIDGFVNGIKQRVQKVVDAVKDIAKTVEEYLGFSCPDKGPLSKYESWMPDFMEGLAKGIEQNKSVVTRAINDLSKDMVLPLDASASMNMAISGSNDSYAAGMVGGFTMNVSVDHINDLNDLLRIQQQAQQRFRMGAV